MPKHASRKSNRFKTNALTAAISVALLPMASSIYAQGATGDSQLEEVVVTGSRITRFEGDFTAPVLSLDVGQIEASGKVNVEDFVSEVASLVGSQGSFESSGEDGGAQVGVNALNMRNLGVDRTLVLVNGRRHVSSIATGSPLVDTNSIPSALIERVDILNGGASAVYGADAVSGAVNFVLKDDFEGFSIRTQTGISSEGDAEENFASFVWGTNFNEGRGNITASYEHRQQERLEIFERDYGLDGREYVVNNPAEYRQTDDPNVPDKIIAGNRTFNLTAPSGRYDLIGYDTVNGVDLGLGDYPLNASGQPYDPGTLVAGFLALGGDGTPTAFFTSQFLPDTTTDSVNVMGRYDINDMATLFTELKYVTTDATNPRSSSFTSNLELGLDNPFIPAAMHDALATIDNASINLARDDLELRSVNDNTRETTRMVFGVRGDLTSWLNYEASYNHGVTDVESRLFNMRREDRYFAAMDAVIDPATGQATCRSNLDPSAVPPTDSIVSSYNSAVWGDGVNGSFEPGPNSGCVPFNPFIDGRDNYFTAGESDPSNPNAAAMDFIAGNGVPLVDQGKIKQTVVNAYVAGSSTPLFELPAGPVDFVLGYESRKEDVSNDVDPIRSNPNGLTSLSFVRSSGSSYDVSEYFTEVSVPIFEDLAPLLQGLRLDGAYRSSDYSTIGTTSAYNLGLNWTLNDSLIVRGSFGESVRAPNLKELFEPDNEGSFRPDDVCEQSNLGSQSANTIANCATALTALGLDPNTFVSASPVGRPGTVGGNPSLEQETSETQTLGFVFTPEFLPGLVASVDYWNIDLTQGILYPSDDEIVEQCYDSPTTVGNPFCDLFSRADTGLIGVIVDLEQRPVNVSALATSGVDFSFTYAMDLGMDLGSLVLGLNGAYLKELKTQPTVAPKQVEEAGQLTTLLGQQAPEWVANISANWTRGPISVNYRMHHQSALARYTSDEVSRQPDISDYLETDALYVHDIQSSYNFDNGIEVYLGVNNLANREPDRTYLNTPIGGKGRYFYAGLTANFEEMSNLNPFR